MDSQWRNFPLVFTLAVAVVTPALGQAVAPTVGPGGSGEEGAASIPDFSGIWVHGLPGSSRWHRAPLRWSTRRAARTAPATFSGSPAITPIRF